LTVVAVLMFLNEEDHLPRTLTSLARQERIPDLLVLCDDGSDDRSAEIATRFCEHHTFARLVSRPRRARDADRLANAAELVGFRWALDQVDGRFDVVAKLDADIDFPPSFFSTIMGKLEAEDDLGISGGPLSIERDGRLVPEPSGRWHVRGATKFYRVACLEQIAPLPTHLGWDTIDELRAQAHGWRVENAVFPDRNAIHLRPTGSYDGLLRGYRRAGVAAWAYGADPLQVIASSFVRMSRKPRVIGGFTYLSAWLGAALRHAPRAEPEVLRLMRRQQRRRIWRRLAPGMSA
jgi:poly-beta-1,6-N-acetyl-D-glucosamine synthase